jgi:aryl-alcohol dehydrogenase-like predicted oxidoreductase
MHTRTLGQGLQVSAIGLGAMGMSQSHGPNPGDRQAMTGVLGATIPRFTTENRNANQALLTHGTRRRERLAGNAAATRVALSAYEIADLNTAAARIGVHGNRYNDYHMSLVGQ